MELGTRPLQSCFHSHGETLLERAVLRELKRLDGSEGGGADGGSGGSSNTLGPARTPRTAVRRSKSEVAS